MVIYYEIQQGDVSIIALSPEGSKRASKALEQADPWGSIPLVYSRSCDDTEALVAILESNSYTNGVDLAKLRAEL